MLDSYCTTPGLQTKAESVLKIAHFRSMYKMSKISSSDSADLCFCDAALIKKHKQIEIKHIATDTIMHNQSEKRYQILSCESHLQKLILYLFKKMSYVISVFK